MIADLVIQGNVQNTHFRLSAIGIADKYNCQCIARNMPDRSVKVRLIGQRDNVHDAIHEISNSNSNTNARVIDVSLTERNE